MSSEPFVSGHPHTDEGPVLGPGWWHYVSVILLIGGVFFGWKMFTEAATADEQRRQIAVAIFILGALPLTITGVRLSRLRKKLGRAQLFLPYAIVPMGFSGSATYMRPMRGGATVRHVEARLQCEESLEKGSGKNRTTHTAIVYDEPVTVVTTPMMERLRLQVPVRIPDKGPPSLIDVRAEIRWLLRLRLQMEGCPNTRSSFEIQVFPVVIQR